MKKEIIDFPNVTVEHFIGRYGEVYNLYINGVLDATYSSEYDLIARLVLMINTTVNRR